MLFDDPFNFFDNFENVVRAQVFTILGLAFLVNILFLIYKKRKLTKIVIYIIPYIILFIAGYNLTIPSDNNKQIITSGQFIEIMQYNNFEISDNYLNDINSTVAINSRKDDIILNYYEFDNVKSSRKAYKKLKQKYLNENNNDQETTILEYFEVDCDGFKKTWIISKVKNTIIYGRADYQNKEELIRIFNSIGYDYK